MNKVIAGYFDDAHRGLQRQRPEQAPRNSGGGVQPLPPLRADSAGSPSVSVQETGGSWHETSGSAMKRSFSTGGIEFTSEVADRGVQDQRYQQVLQENSRLSRKLRAMQDTLSITTAKKDAFRAQAVRLEKEFKKGREQTDDLQKDLLESKRAADQYAKESSEAIKMMSEMRQAHLQEVRLLQRGLEARGNDEKFRNRVNEVADLVDKLGRAVVQREESMRDKVKAEQQSNKMITDLRALADECSKLRKQNKSQEARLKEAIRKGKGAAPPPIDRALAELDESDEEFETEILHFEKRFKILEEGPMGLDILASNLARDKRLLEKALKQSQEAHRACSAALEEWKALANTKDNTITELNKKIEDLMMAQAALEEEIDRKRREVEEAVNTERANLEARMAELQAEAEEYKAQADSMVLQSDKLSQELMKVHEQYDDAQRRKAEAKDKEEGEPDEPDAEDDGNWDKIAEEDYPIKTKAGVDRPVTLNIQVWQHAENNQTQFRAREGADGRQTCITLTEEIVDELDTADGWDFSRVGLSSGPDDPKRKVVLSAFVGIKEAKLAPDDTAVVCHVYKFDAMRYYISGVSMSNDSDMDEIMISKEDLAADEELSSAIEAGLEDDELIERLLAKLSFENGKFSFESFGS